MKFENIRQKLNEEMQYDIQVAMEKQSYLTDNEKAKIAEGKKTIEDYRQKISKKIGYSFFSASLDKLDQAETDNSELTSIDISVEWIKSKTWGMNPQATIRFFSSDNRVYTHISERISGCGYDKESAATAGAFNQCIPLLKLLYEVKENNIEKSNSECIAYGAGYGVLPYFESGVGFSSHREILKKIGFTLKNSSSGKMFDHYYFVKEGK